MSPGGLGTNGGYRTSLGAHQDGEDLFGEVFEMMFELYLYFDVDYFVRLCRIRGLDHLWIWCYHDLYWNPGRWPTLEVWLCLRQTVRVTAEVVT